MNFNIISWIKEMYRKQKESDKIVNELIKIKEDTLKKQALELIKIRVDNVIKNKAYLNDYEINNVLIENIQLLKKLKITKEEFDDYFK